MTITPMIARMIIVSGVAPEEPKSRAGILNVYDTEKPDIKKHLSRGEISPD